MDVRNCRRCGKIFTYRGMPVCQDCFEADEMDFKKVREYLDGHPGASTMEVSVQTEVDVKTITRFLREGRLEAEGVTVIDSDLACEKCGKAIGSGRYCDDCLKKMQIELKEAAQRLEKAKEREWANRGRVHTLDRFKED